MRLLRSTAIVGVLTMASRVLGLVREMLLAASLGAGVITDVFLTAFQFPNLFRRIFAEGAFNSAFIPLYAGKLESGEQDEAIRFARQVMSVLLTSMLVLVIAAQFLMPWLMYALGPGFVGEPGPFRLAVLLTQITMPYLMMMSLSAMLSGVLNSHGRFAVAAAAPVLLNLILIGILLFSPANGEQLALHLSIGISLSGVAQLVWLFAACRATGLRLSVSMPRMTPGVRRLITLGIPGAIAAGVTQINILVTSSIATIEEGAKSWLYFADRLYQLPLGVVGIAMGVVLLPALSARVRAGETQAASNAMNRALEISMALTLPAATALATIPVFIATGLYERNAFTSQDAVMVSQALVPFAIGLPAFVLIKVLSPGFFAREDTMTPMKFAAIGVAVNLALGLGLFFGPLGFAGLAIATAVAGWVNMSLLAITLSRRGLFEPDIRLLGKLPRIVLACAAMAAFLLVAEHYADALRIYLFDSTLLTLLVVCCGGLGVYGIAALVTGALRPSEVRGALKRS
ncbi:MULTISPECIES: murein biosynthesis integral membrane protein MurJ [Maricaulis]|jgi:putative peptidoglycan lipid II flippase|uniref:Probable lipid II flippase MurJ n=1 Tax=Maricaulis maris (strain MCS10) TaxID=394221 RepID=Q0AK89_MARMM|nr:MULTISPECIES: murein biosynthesis integral membrane protein MurJ [Maricaulis]ABI67304.1 integral membrane protein MviN [Maricaulis maris MCS10]MAC88009.1 murein biosynthesis integral membrane protein MurJ [Maricaulis sp.]